MSAAPFAESNAYVTCSGCRGYGVVESWGPSVEDCRDCKGSGVERRRDERGRYAPSAPEDGAS